VTADPEAESPDPHEVLALVRDRLLLDAGALDGELRAFSPDVIPDLWIAPVFDGDLGRVAVVYAPNAHPVAQAGLDRASARLRDLDVAGRDRSWVTENLRPLLDAVGGLSPGQPPFAEEEPLDLSRCLRFDTTATWVTFAAGGAKGAPPIDEPSPDARGVAPPPAPGSMTVEVDDDHRITWTYEVAGATIGTFGGHWSDDDTRSQQLNPLFAEHLVAAARTQAESPLAVAGAPVRRLHEAGATAVWEVRLLGHDPMEITVTAGIPRPGAH
jgi:hypothetical protein